VSEAQVREILDVARWAPSGGNLQPWRVIAVAGAERDAIVALARRSNVVPRDTRDDRPVYPAPLWEPYRTRRFRVGEQMYALLGIERDDRAGRLARFGSNFEFFGAPVALFIVIDRRMGHGQWAHVGMFMQSLVLVAQERGLATCMQEAWAALRPELATHFGLAETDVVYCAIALGHADPSAAVNGLRSERVAVDEFAEFRGFTSADTPP
jgi:nitroreductase